MTPTNEDTSIPMGIAVETVEAAEVTEVPLTAAQREERAEELAEAVTLAIGRSRVPMEGFYTYMDESWTEIEDTVERSRLVDEAGARDIAEPGTILAELIGDIDVYQKLRVAYKKKRDIAEEELQVRLGDEMLAIGALHACTLRAFEVYVDQRDASELLCACFSNDMTKSNTYLEKLPFSITEGHECDDIDFLLKTRIHAFEFALGHIEDELDPSESEGPVGVAAETKRMLKLRGVLVRHKFQTHGDSVDCRTKIAMDVLSAEAYRVSAFNRLKMHTHSENSDEYAGKVSEVDVRIENATQRAYELSVASARVAEAVKKLHDVVHNECETMIMAFVHANILERNAVNGGIAQPDVIVQPDVKRARVSE